MNSNSRSGWQLLLILAVLLLLSACASKIPSTLPLPESEQPLVRERLQEFQAHLCTTSLDADVTMEWQGYGKSEKYPGLLQLQPPAFLRYAIVDPLGRQLLILVSDGTDFTLVNNRNASAVIGSLSSNFWRKYVPACIAPRDYISWLTGRLPVQVFEAAELRQGKEPDKGIWLVTKWKDGIRHHILFDAEIRRIQRHMVEGEGGKILLDVSYSNYKTANNPDCERPNLVQIEGAGISGTLTIRFDAAYSESPIPEDFFHLSIPEHFSQEIVE